MVHSQKIPLPNTEQDFEAMCAHIFGKKFQCVLPVMYGRRGQKQYGLDILIHQNNDFDKTSRIGIQCKHVQQLSFDKVSGDSVKKEVEKADKGQQEIKLLLIVTSISSDTVLQDQVAAFSDIRVKEGLFPVTIVFWNDLTNYINQDHDLTNFYQTDPSIIDTHFELIKEYIEEENFNLALKILDKNKFLDQFNITNQFRNLLLKTECYLYLDQNEDLKKSLYELEKYEWKDERHTILKLKNLQRNNNKNIKEIIRKSLKEYPNSLKIKIIDYFYKILDLEYNIDISDIEPQLRENETIQYYFLSRYTNNKDFLKYEKIYNTISNNIKKKTNFILVHLAFNINKYITNKTEENNNKIKESLLMIEPYQIKIYEIERSELRSLAVKMIIKGYIHTKNSYEMRALYNYLDQCNLLNEENIEEILYKLYSTEEIDVFLSIAKSKFNFLKSDVQVTVLENLIYKNDIKFIEEKIEILPKEEKQYINSLLWSSQLDDQVFISKITENNAIEHESLHSLIAIALKLKTMKDTKLLFNQFDQKILGYKDIQEEIKTLAFYYFNTNQHKICINFFEKILKTDSNYNITIALFESYIIVKNFKEAKKIFEDHLYRTVNQISPNKIMKLCYEMAQQTMDWTLCEALIKNVEKNNQDQAWLWMTKLQIAYQHKPKTEQLKIIRSLPENLNGLSNNICWLARQEAFAKLYEKSRNRIKKLWRDNLNNQETESEILRFLFSFINQENERNYFMNETVDQITAGSVVNIRINDAEQELIIDFYDQKNIGNNFISPESQLGKELIGKKVGDIFIKQSNFGIDNEYQITNIRSILSFLWDDLIRKSENISNQYSFFESIPMKSDSEDGIKASLDLLYKQSEKRKESITYWLSSYKEHPFTTGLLSKKLGIDLAKLVYEWEFNFDQKLHSIDNSYISEENEKAYFEENYNNTFGFVIDLFTLIELKYFNCFEILNKFKNIYLSRNCYQQLKYLIEIKKIESNNKNKKGTLFFDKESPVFVEHDYSHEEEIINNLEYIFDYIENNANFIIESAYGDGKIHELDNIINDLLTQEENSCLRLARGLGLPLVSFDARLRALSKQVGINTINMDDIIISHQTKTDKNLYFFPENKLISHRTISNLYLSDKKIIEFIFDDFNNFYKYISISLHNFSTQNIENATLFYFIFIEKLLLNTFTIDYITLDYLNKLFLIVYMDKNNAIALFDDLKDSLFNHFPDSYKNLSSYTENYESIIKTKHQDFKILHGTLKPKIYLK